jgi:hypothetical protein
MARRRANLVFRLTSGSGGEYKALGRLHDAPHVPAVGELVNIDGNPYIVTQRGWALDTDAGEEEGSEALWCYLTVSPSQSGQAGP